MSPYFPLCPGISLYLMVVTQQLHLPGYANRMASAHLPASALAEKLFGNSRSVAACWGVGGYSTRE